MLLTFTGGKKKKGGQAEELAGNNTPEVLPPPIMDVILYESYEAGRWIKAYDFDSCMLCSG